MLMLWWCCCCCHGSPWRCHGSPWCCHDSPWWSCQGHTWWADDLVTDKRDRVRGRRVWFGHCLVLVLEGLGKRVVVNFHLRDLHALVGGDCDEGSFRETDGCCWGRAITRCYQHVEHIFIHSVQENLLHGNHTVYK